MKIETVMDYVVPCGGMFYKHCNGMYDFYKSDRDFENGIAYYTQEYPDTFQGFIAKLINKLMVEEKETNDPEPLVTIDYAIHYKEINSTYPNNKVAWEDNMK